MHVVSIDLLASAGSARPARSLIDTVTGDCDHP